MKAILLLLGLLQLSCLFVHSSPVSDAAERLEKLQTLAATLKPSSTREQVAEVLGEPLTKGYSSWNEFGQNDPNLWTYLEFVNEEAFFGFKAEFKESDKVIFTPRHVRRSELKKGENFIETGVVIDEPAWGPKTNGLGVIMVRFDRRETLCLLVDQKALHERIHGAPVKGGRFRWESSVDPWSFEFKALAEAALYLDSLVFEPAANIDAKAIENGKIVAALQTELSAFGKKGPMLDELAAKFNRALGEGSAGGKHAEALMDQIVSVQSGVTLAAAKLQKVLPAGEADMAQFPGLLALGSATYEPKNGIYVIEIPMGYRVERSINTMKRHFRLVITDGGKILSGNFFPK